MQWIAIFCFTPGGICITLMNAYIMFLYKLCKKMQVLHNNCKFGVSIKLIDVTDCLKINTHCSPNIYHMHGYAQLHIRIDFECEKNHKRLVQHLRMILSRGPRKLIVVLYDSIHVIVGSNSLR